MAGKLGGKDRISWCHKARRGKIDKGEVTFFSIAEKAVRYEDKLILSIWRLLVTFLRDFRGAVCPKALVRSKKRLEDMQMK